MSGGARGVVTCAREYTMANGIVLTKFLPAYEKYGQAGLRYSYPVVGAMAEQTETQDKKDGLSLWITHLKFLFDFLF